MDRGAITISNKTILRESKIKFLQDCGSRMRKYHRAMYKRTISAKLLLLLYKIWASNKANRSATKKKISSLLKLL